MQPFELGPVQKIWLQSLKDHPERQAVSVLGYGTPEKYKACCLGEYLICYNRINNLPAPFEKDVIFDDKISETSALFNSHEKLGLVSGNGRLIPGYPRTELLKDYSPQNMDFLALSHLNDYGMTWPQIAVYIETYPEFVFTKSV